MLGPKRLLWTPLILSLETCFCLFNYIGGGGGGVVVFFHAIASTLNCFMVFNTRQGMCIQLRSCGFI